MDLQVEDVVIGAQDVASKRYLRSWSDLGDKVSGEYVSDRLCSR